MLRSEAGTEGLLGVPFFVASLAAGNAATHWPLPRNKSLRVLITEYNVMERAGPLKLSWLHALFCAATALALLSVPQVDGAMLHVLLNGFGWGALYETDADFRGPFGGQPPPGSSATALGRVGCLVPACKELVTRPYSPTCVGTALGALSAALASARSAAPLELAAGSAANPMRTGQMPSALPGNISYPSLLGWRFSASAVSAAVTPLPAGGGGGGGGRGGGWRDNATVLNLSPYPLAHVTAGEGREPCASYTTWSTPDAEGGSPLAWASISHPVQRTVTACDGSGRVQLLPFSITTIAFVAAEDQDAGRRMREKRADARTVHIRAEPEVSTI